MSFHKNTKTQLQEMASKYLEIGLSVIPANKHKKPVIPTKVHPERKWGIFRKKAPTLVEAQSLFKPSTEFIAIITGKVSGNLEAIDIDVKNDPEKTLWERYKSLIEELDPNLLDCLIIQKTVSGGYHLLYSCEEIEGNQILSKNKNKEVLIETRGEGGYICCSPSPGYTLLQGSFSEIPKISTEERETLLNCARSLNEYVEEKEVYQIERTKNDYEGLSPFDDYDQRDDILSTLEQYGWTSVFQRNGTTYLRRPGKSKGISATFNSSNKMGLSRRLFVFSTSTEFETERLLKPSYVFSVLECNKDFQEAAKKLSLLGYGDKPKFTSFLEIKPPQETSEEAENYFKVNEKGVWYLDTDSETGKRKPPIWICAPLYVKGQTRDENSNNWGYSLEFIDNDKQTHKWAMPAEMLEDNAKELRKILLSKGLKISLSPKTRYLLARYIQESESEKLLRCVEKIGWHKGSFILPDQTFGKGEEEVILQSKTNYHEYKTSGTLEEWKTNLAAPCVGNSRLIFSLSTAFAPPLLELIRLESGGFHILGHSSTGKTTALHVSCSVWGNYDFMKSWRVTANGLEGTALKHNNLLLALDEIHQIQPKVAGEIAYMLSNGKGKIRADRNGEAREPAHWNLLFLSSGEIGLADYMQQSNRTSTGGQEVRVVEISADAEKGYGLFEELHGFEDGHSFSNQLTQAANSYYGTAGREFLTQLTQYEKTKIQSIVKRSQEKFLELSKLSKEAHGQIHRVAKRFSLVAAAGELATLFDITGWKPGYAINATLECFNSWLKSRGSETESHESKNIYAKIQHFFEQHGESRFSSWNSAELENSKTSNRAGFRRKVGEGFEYYVFPETFKKEICAGSNYKSIAKNLAQKGIIAEDKNGNPSIPKWLPGIGKKRVYYFPFNENNNSD